VGKVLYAFIWKQGDLPKLKHILKGIMSEEQPMGDEGLILYNFGRSLREESKEPIVDQHVLRTYQQYSEGKWEEFNSGKKSIQRKRDLILKYKSWIKEEFSERIDSDPDFLYH